MNGLHHCSRLLDAARPEPSAASSSQGPSLRPEHFDYFCLYNSELGRHEAYYQAVVDTTVHLPAAAAGSRSASAVNTGGTNASTVAGTGSSLSVAVAAGELINVEFSYKYSQQEVQQLAASAGLVRVKIWSDAQQRYDLHLLQCRG